MQERVRRLRHLGQFLHVAVSDRHQKPRATKAKRLPRGLPADQRMQLPFNCSLRAACNAYPVHEVRKKEAGPRRLCPTGSFPKTILASVLTKPGRGNRPFRKRKNC